MHTLKSSADAFLFIQPLISTDVEELWLLALGPGLQIKHYGLIFKGTVDRCLIHPREILRPLLIQNASQFIIVHSHPSGDCTPSPQDIQFTKKLKKISHLLEIKLLDHLIVTSNTYISMSKLNLF